MQSKLLRVNTSRLDAHSHVAEENPNKNVPIIPIGIEKHQRTINLNSNAFVNDAINELKNEEENEISFESINVIGQFQSLSSIASKGYPGGCGIPSS